MTSMPCKDCELLLAQVAVLCEASEGARCPEGMPNEGDIDFWYERLNHVLAETPAAARALLDRLQRAEAVVKAASYIVWEVDRLDEEDINYCDKAEAQQLMDALAAWEEQRQ